jgi:hypothetical protein
MWRTIRLKVILGAILWCGAALTLTVGTSAAAASSSTPSAAAQSSYVNAVHSNDPDETAIPSSEIVTLGEAVCNLFANGKSLDYVTGQLGGVSNEGKSFPAQFVSAVITQAPMYLCLQYLSKVLTLRPTSAGPAPLRAPGSAAQKAFIDAVDSDGSTEGFSDKTLINLGEGVCSLLQVHTLTYTLKTVTGTGKEYLPPQFVATLMKESPKYFCPQYVSKTKSASSAPTPSAKSALMALLPSGVTHCDSPLTSSQIPTEMMGLIASAACDAPKLGAKSFIYAYEFDNASDYAASLKNLNAFKEFVPTSPSVGCPTSNSSDHGSNQWGNNIFPPRSGQILECEWTAANGKGVNNIPDYLWTLPTKYLIIDTAGDPGSTMQHLDAWWTAYSG